MVMDEFEYLDDCAMKWESIPSKRLTRQQQAVVDVVTTIGLIEGDGVESLWHQFGDSMDRIIESFRMAKADEIADILEKTSFCKDIIARTPPDADDWVYETEEEEKFLTEALFLVSSKGPDAREGLLPFLPKRKN